MFNDAKKLLGELESLKSTCSLDPVVASHFKKIERLLRAAAQREFFLGEILDRILIGVLIVDDTGKPFITNQFADQLMSEKQGLTLAPDGLRADSARDTRELRKQIRAALSKNENGSSGSAEIVALERTGNAWPLLAWAVPLERTLTLEDEQISIAAVFVADPNRDLAINPKHLTGLCGLTRVQAHITSELLRGDRLDEIAATIGISTNTARGHLKQTFSKTYTDRQLGLYRFFDALFGVVRTD